MMLPLAKDTALSDPMILPLARTSVEQPMIWPLARKLNVRF